jgi:predicted PhzF superfamily epimerase YddE/YHI9
MADGWVGRVFVNGTVGGKHVAVVTGVESNLRERATALGLGNVTFVTRYHDRRVFLRTFTPNEELALCFTAALAAPVALGARPGESWHIEHRAGAQLVSVHGDADAPVCWAADGNQPHRHGTPLDAQPLVDLPGWFPPNRGVWRINQTRSRIYAHVDDPDALAPSDPGELRQLCANRGCRGLVFFGDDGRTVRSREFSSVDGGELIATGAAALGIGSLLHSRGQTTEMKVVQGPPHRASQGHLLLRFTSHGPQIGGQVLPLVKGQLVAPDVTDAS